MTASPAKPPRLPASVVRANCVGGPSRLHRVTDGRRGLCHAKPGKRWGEFSKDGDYDRRASLRANETAAVVLEPRPESG